MKKKQRQGFTLIEILIVVAIIAILASVVLVGLGPTQQQGRDARRLSDLRDVQTALELYYSKNGSYPNETSWAAMSTDLINGGIGISQVPNDPSGGHTYYYQSYPAGANPSSYVIGAKLENSSNVAFQQYSAPQIGGTVEIPTGMTSCTQANSEYCLSL